jgi:cell division protein FtsQ
MTPSVDSPAAAARPPAVPPRRGIGWRRVFLTVVTGAIIVGVAWALLGSSLLVVRRIQVTGSSGVVAARIRAASGIRPGTPLARLDLAQARRRVEHLRRVLSARVTRSWPDTVLITVRMRTPALAVASDGGFELVDPYGVVVRRSASHAASLPLLRDVPGRLRGNPSVRAAASVLRELPASVRSQVISVSAPGAGAITLRLRGQVTVRWGGTGWAAMKARELRVLLRTHARYYDISSPGEAVTSR